MQYNTDFLQRTGLWRWAWLLQPGPAELRFRRISPEGQSVLGVTRFSAQCHAGLDGDDRLVCRAFDGTRTRFVSVDAATGHLTPFAWMPGPFSAWMSNGNWLSGWSGAGATTIDLRRHEALKVPSLPYERVTHLAATDRMLAAVFFRGTSSRLRLYSLDGS
jgi:hypothetical protein